MAERQPRGVAARTIVWPRGQRCACVWDCLYVSDIVPRDFEVHGSCGDVRSREILPPRPLTIASLWRDRMEKLTLASKLRRRSSIELRAWNSGRKKRALCQCHVARVVVVGFNVHLAPCSPTRDCGLKPEPFKRRSYPDGVRGVPNPRPRRTISTGACE